MIDKKDSTSSLTSSVSHYNSESLGSRGERELHLINPSVKSGLQKFLWVNVVACLRKDRKLCKTFCKFLNVLSVPKDLLHKFKHIPPVIQQFMDAFGSQNCLKAISVLEDLTAIRKNQYKFMFEGLSLAKAIDILINESIFLFKGLSKKCSRQKSFFGLVNTWVDHLFLIHNVKIDAQEELKLQILIRIAILNGISDDFNVALTTRSQNNP